MKLLRGAICVLLLLLPTLAFGQTIGTYPPAQSPLAGTEGMLSSQANSGCPIEGCTVEISPIQIANFTASEAAAYGLIYNNNGSIAGLVPTAIGQYCLEWTALNAAPTLVTCTSGGSGTVNSGTAGQFAVYNATGTTVGGSADISFSLGALNLGASGTLGTLTFGNATSGTETVTPPTGALGTLTITLPGTSGTLALTSGNVATATALAATPTTCSATQAATGILANGNATGCFTPSGSGTVTDGAGTTTANELLLSSTTAHAYTNATTLPTSALPALAGDVTSSAGSNSVTVSKVNGASYPSSPAGPGIFSLRFDPTSSTPVGATADQVGAHTRSISGVATTDTVLYSDVLGIVLHDKAATGAVNETLPTPTSLGNSAFAYYYCNDSAQLDTITPTTWTIAVNGAAAGASISVSTGECVQITVDPFNASQWDAFSFGAANWLNAASSGTSVTPVCNPGAQRTVTTVTATGNFTINAPTGCTEGQQVMLKITYTASDTYTWNAAYHANAANPGALPTATGGTSGVDMFIFYDDAANSRFDYLAEAPAF